MPGLPLVIGLAGPARCGKDTAADIIMEERPEYVKASFADPLKDMLRVGLGLNAAQLYGGDKETVDHRYECSPRHIMQTLGTEWGRKLIHPDIWLRAMAARVNSPTIIPDVRFPNEAQFVRERGVLIHIVGRGGIASAHQSESGLKPVAGDEIIANTEGLETYGKRVREVLDYVTRA